MYEAKIAMINDKKIYDGKPVYSVLGVTFRNTPSLLINGILFQTFFGGDGAEYGTPSATYVDFAGFSLYNYPKATPGLCVTNLPLLK